MSSRRRAKRNPPVIGTADAEKSIPRSSRAGWFFWFVTAICVLWIFVYALATDRVLADFCASMDRFRGAEPGKMPVILRFMAFDGYVWTRYAEHLREDGRIRLRWTDFDNAPHGREVHWNSAFAWYLRGLGWLRQQWVNEPRRVAIARMSIWANPILLAIFLPWFSWAAARRFGDAAGVVTALGMLCAPAFFEGFFPGYPDHHGLISATVLGCVFGIAWGGAGWVSTGGDRGLLPRDAREARRGIWISAMFGAAGLWFSAISITLVMVGIGLGILAASLYAGSGNRSDCAYHPELWRLWGRVGALAGLTLYLLEYFPARPALRLEVNHPLYALAWWGAGEALAAVTGWITERRTSGARFPWKTTVPAVLALLPIPILVLLLGARVHAAMAPFLAAIHTYIGEFKPLLWRIENENSSLFAFWGVFPLILIVAAPMLFIRRLGVGVRSVVAFLLCPLLTIVALQFYQVRWNTLSAPIYIALGAIVMAVIWPRLGRRRRSALVRPGLAILLFALFAFLPLAVAFPTLRGALQPLEKRRPDQFEALHLVMRDIAATLRRGAGDRPVTLLSSPNSSALIGAFGDFHTIGTLYWENAEGLEAAARMFAAQSDEEALRRLRERGVTHIALINWENFIEPYVRIVRPDGGNRAVENSFGIQALFRRRLPVWCRPIPYPRYPLMDSLGLDVLLLEVRPEQTPEEAAFHEGLYHLAEKRPVKAEQLFREILREHPDRHIARMWLAVALADAGRGERAAGEFIVALRNVEPGPERENLLLRAAHHLLSAGAVAPAVAVLDAFPPAIAPEDPVGAKRANLLAWILATQRDAGIRNPERALELLGIIQERGAAGQVPWGDTRAAALAALGRFEEAIETLERHIGSLSEEQQRAEIFSLLQRRLQLYREGRAWLEP